MNLCAFLGADSHLGSQYIRPPEAATLLVVRAMVVLLVDDTVRYDLRAIVTPDLDYYCEFVDDSTPDWRPNRRRHIGGARICARRPRQEAGTYG